MRTHTRIKLIGAVLAGAGPLLLASLGAPAALAAGTDGTANTTLLDRTEVAAGQFNASAEERFPDAFGGIQVQDATDVTLFVASGANSAGLLQSLRVTLGGSVSVDVVTVRRSKRDLLSLQGQLVSDNSTWASQGIQMAKLQPDVPAGTVDITLEAPPAAAPVGYVSGAQSLLDARYGGGLVRVEEQTMKALPTLYTRYDDTVPYWGGDFILWPQVSTCSTGFPVSYNGRQGVLTASHCGLPGVTYYIAGWNYSWNSNDPFGTASVFWGDNQFNSCNVAAGGGNWCTDFEFVATTGSVQADVYNGPAGCSSDSSSTCQGGYPVHGWVEPTYNPNSPNYMAADGAVTGQVTNHDVTMDDGCAWLPDQYTGVMHWVCGVGDMVNDGACQPGDSGGPTYQRANGGVYAAGIILGGDSSDCYFQEMSSMLSLAPGLTVLTR